MDSGPGGGDCDVLVLGGGLAGLACRAALPAGRAATVLEAADEPGGLLRMHPHGPYSFDSVPHVLFFRSRKLLEWLRVRLDVPLRSFTRTNSIWQARRRIPYPYQFNAAALPPHVAAECLASFRRGDDGGRGEAPDATFAEWLTAQFGAGFVRHFFRPYNEKLYGVPLDALEAAPLRWTIPSDDEAAVRAGVGDPAGAPTLLYPAGTGGIGEITDALMRIGHGPVVTGQRVVAVDAAARTVRTAAGAEWRYRSLVSTLALPDLLDAMGELPEDVRAARQALACRAITVVRVGVRRTGPAFPDIWTYFPDPEIPFYRLTRLERISPDLAPEGGAALLLECAGTTEPDRADMIRFLDTHGIAAAADVEHYSIHHVPYAYVLFTQGHRRAVQRIRRFLTARGVVSAGRYGVWLYADIEMAMKSGMSAARRLEGGIAAALGERPADAP